LYVGRLCLKKLEGLSPHIHVPLSLVYQTIIFRKHTITSYKSLSPDDNFLIAPNNPKPEIAGTAARRLGA
jgi:hypothetical protein